jgi:hypothetical protein
MQFSSKGFLALIDALEQLLLNRSPSRKLSLANFNQEGWNGHTPDVEGRSQTQNTLAASECGALPISPTLRDTACGL